MDLFLIIPLLLIGSIVDNIGSGIVKGTGRHKKRW